MVWEELATHVMIVSDSPDATLEANRRVEEILRELDVAFSLTPIRVVDAPPGASE